MNSSESNRSNRPPGLTTWTIGNRRYYSPMVHALEGRAPADSSPRTRPNLLPRRQSNPPTGTPPASGKPNQDPT